MTAVCGTTSLRKTVRLSRMLSATSPASALHVRSFTAHLDNTVKTRSMDVTGRFSQSVILSVVLSGCSVAGWSRYLVVMRVVVDLESAFLTERTRTI